MEPKDLLQPHKNGGVTEQELAAFEEKYGVTLPQSMKDFYKIQNGGYFRRDKDFIITADEEDDEDALALSDFRPFTRPFTSHANTIDTLVDWQRMDGFLPDTIVPFCSDDAGDFYYIQADGQGERVWYIFHEDYDAFLDDPSNCLVADSFTAFLEMIHIRELEDE